MATGTSASRTSRTLLYGGIGAVVLVAAFLLWFFGGDDPDAVDIDQAVSDVTATASATDGASEAAADDGPETGGDLPEVVDPQGTWTVDTDAVPYSFADSTGSFVGFRIDEELNREGAVQAVGRTPGVTGSLTLDGATITAAQVTGDVTQLSTDRSMRDGRTRSAFGTDTVAFVLSEPIELGEEPVVGTTIDATATGELTVNDVTRSYDVPLQAVVTADGLLVVTGSFAVSLADHEVVAPQAGPVLSVSDVATVELQLYLTK